MFIDQILKRESMFSWGCYYFNVSFYSIVGDDIFEGDLKDLDSIFFFFSFLCNGWYI